MKRDSVVFYRSYYEAVKDLPPEEFKEAVSIILDYALDGKKIPEDASPCAKMAYFFTRPQIDVNNKRYENGKKGGAPRKAAAGKDDRSDRGENEPDEGCGDTDDTKTEDRYDVSGQEPKVNPSTSKTEPTVNRGVTKIQPAVNPNITKPEPKHNQAATKTKPNGEKSDAKKDARENPAEGAKLLLKSGSEQVKKENLAFSKGTGTNFEFNFSKKPNDNQTATKPQPNVNVNANVNANANVIGYPKDYKKQKDSVCSPLDNYRTIYTPSLNTVKGESARTLENYYAAESVILPAENENGESEGTDKPGAFDIAPEDNFGESRDAGKASSAFMQALRNIMDLASSEVPDMQDTPAFPCVPVSDIPARPADEPAESGAKLDLSFLRRAEDAPEADRQPDITEFDRESVVCRGCLVKDLNDYDLVRDIVAVWNSNPNVIRVKRTPSYNTPRCNKVLLLAKKVGIEQLYAVLDMLKDCMYFTDKWKPGFDWFCEEPNFVKIEEGTYLVGYRKKDIDMDEVMAEAAEIDAARTRRAPEKPDPEDLRADEINTEDRAGPGCRLNIISRGFPGITVKETAGYAI